MSKKTLLITLILVASTVLITTMAADLVGDRHKTIISKTSPTLIAITIILMLSIILVLLVYILMDRQKYQAFNLFPKIKNKKDYLIKTDELAWLVDKHTGKINENPYCPKHEIKLIINESLDETNPIKPFLIYNFYCTRCKKNILTNITEKGYDNLILIAQNEAEAIYNKHAKNIK